MAPHNKMYALITVHSMLNYCMRPLIPPLAEFIAVRLAIFTAPPHPTADHLICPPPASNMAWPAKPAS